ncbi:MAG: hypothetical protein NVS1B13_11850 [Flavisolibacter sp.]
MHEVSPALDFNKKIAFYLLAFLFLFYIVNGIYYLQAQSATFDEGSFLHYAIKLVMGHPERTSPMQDNSKMPIAILNLLPRAIEQVLHPTLEKKMTVAVIVSGRYITLFFSVFIIWIVFVWSKQLYGIYAGLFSAFLMSLCPNMIASAGLVTTDSYSMLFLLISMYYLWKFTKTGAKKHFLCLSVFIALSQLVKQSLFHLYFIFPVALFIYYLIVGLKLKWSSVATYLIVFGFINWLIINLGFYYRDTNTLIKNYHFMSHAFLSLQQFLPGWVPIPLPKAFVDGLDMAKYFDQVGGGNYDLSSFGKVTILGHASTYGSFWYYYLASLLFKTPIPSLIFIALGFMMMVKKRSWVEFIKNELFLLLPVLYYLVYLSLFYKTQCGIRHIIFIYPFLYILCGRVMQLVHNKYSSIGIFLLSILLIASVLRYWGNYYPYTNELVWDKKMAYQYVGASNLEFNQGAYFFQKYISRHPEVRLVPERPAPGTFLINTNDYLDIWNLHRYDWISHLKPSGHVAYNGLLIRVRQQDLEPPGVRIK